MQQGTPATLSPKDDAQPINKGLARLLSHEVLFAENHTQAIRLICETAATALQSAQLSLWLFNQEHTRLSCTALYDARSGLHSSGGTLTERSQPDLFAELKERHSTLVPNPKGYRESSAFQAAHLHHHRLGSLLSYRVLEEDRFLGLLWIGYQEAGAPESEERDSFARAAATCIALSLRSQIKKLDAESREVDTRRLNQIIEFLPDATFVIDTCGRVVAWNQAIEKMTGHKKFEMVGNNKQPYSLAFYGTQRPMLIDMVLQEKNSSQEAYGFLQRDGDSLIGEARIPHFNGHDNAVLWGSARPLYDEAGRVTGAIESIRDITSRKNAEKAADDWKRRYEMVAAASGQITYEHVTEIACILWSKASDFILGLHLSELGGTVRAWFDLMYPDDRDAVRASLNECLSSGSPFEAEYRLRNSNGDYLWFRDRAYFSINALGQRCLLGMLSDITATRTAELALKQAHDHLEHRVRVRTEELGIVNKRLLNEILERESTQQKLESSEEKYRTMVDALPQVVFEVDLAGKILRLNYQGFVTGGLEPEDLLDGANIMDFVHPDDRQRLRANWERLLAGDPLNGTEYTFVRKNGTSYPATSYAQLITKDGVPLSVTGFLIDETPRKKAQEALVRAHNELEERVTLRTTELADSNTSLRRLLTKQEMNIELAHKVLLLVNSAPARHLALRDGLSLFISAQMLPREIEGGDHFFVRNGNGSSAHQTFISLKDESGHEVGCILRSIITDLIHNALLTHSASQNDLAATITRLNAEICSSNLFQDGEFLTSVNLQINRDTLELNYLLAGHPPFMLIREGRVIDIPNGDRSGMNLPLGMIGNHQFNAGFLLLLPGDKIILYTDGLLEASAPGPDGPLTSRELPSILQAVIDELGDAPVTTLAQRLFTKLSGLSFPMANHIKGFPDDISILVAEIEQPTECFEEVLHPSDLSDLRGLRSQLMDKIQSEWLARGIHVSNTRLQFVMEEALLNAWRHGNACSPEKAITVRRSYGNDARLEIIDEGPGFPLSDITDPTSFENRLKPSGRGLFMIRRFSDEAQWVDEGRHLILHFSNEEAFAPQDKTNPLQHIKLWQTA